MRERKESPALSGISVSIKFLPITLAIVDSVATGIKRFASSPPSPVFDLPPIRFMAIAKVACASVDIEPKDIAPVANRFTISFADSTCSSGIAGPTDLTSNKPRNVL